MDSSGLLLNGISRSSLCALLTILYAEDQTLVFLGKEKIVKKLQVIISWLFRSLGEISRSHLKVLSDYKKHNLERI